MHVGAPAEDQLSDEKRKRQEQEEKRRVRYEQWADLVSTGVFSDLAQTGGCDIPQAENRAIDLNQLQLIETHLIQRLANGPAWEVSRLVAGGWEKQQLREPGEVSLYDLNEHAILPFTSIRQCSMTEMLASASQPPDFFVSHVSEPVHNHCVPDSGLGVVVGRARIAFCQVPPTACGRPQARVTDRLSQWRAMGLRCCH